MVLVSARALWFLRSYCHGPVIPNELKKETVCCDKNCILLLLCSISRNISLNKRKLNHRYLKYVTGVRR